MTIYTIAKAQENLDQLINQVGESHIPVYIAEKNVGAVLISEDDWKIIQNTLASK